MKSFLTDVNRLLICTMQETKKGLATFKESLISNHLYFFPIKNVRKSYSVHLEEPHLLRLRCMENSKGLLNPIFDSRSLDPKVRLFTYIFYNVDYAIFSLISRVLKETFVTTFFLNHPVYYVCSTPFSSSML